MKILLVRVGRGRYAVAANAVSRILDPTTDTTFRLEQTTGDLVCGEVRYSVIDLHGTTGERRQARALYLLLEDAPRRVVVAVDGAEEIREIPADAIAPLPSFIFATRRRLFRGIFADAEGPTLLLDEKGLL